VANAHMIVIGASKHARPKAREGGEVEATERINSIDVSGRQLHVGEYKVLKLIDDVNRKGQEEDRRTLSMYADIPF
jgi:hypothetical protein